MSLLNEREECSGSVLSHRANSLSNPVLSENSGSVKDHLSTASPSARLLAIPARQLVIRGDGRKSSPFAPEGRPWVTHLGVTILLIAIGVGSLVAIVPLDSNADQGVMFGQISQKRSQGGQQHFLTAQQSATVTAVTQDGYDAGTGESYAGLSSAPSPTLQDNAGSTLDRFSYGQCTYWADLRYFQLSGHWVSWSGDAYQWATGAASAGWIVSSTPRVPSVIVLQPGVQGATGFGHVAVVEHINPDGSILTSNYNWSSWNTLSYQTFWPGSGVSFLWHP